MLSPWPANRPGIRHGRVLHLLAGIEDRQAAQRATGMQRDERLAFGIAGPGHRQQHAAAKRAPARRRAEYPLKHDALGHVQVALYQVASAGHEHRAVAGLSGLLHGRGECLGVVLLAVGHRAEILHVQGHRGWAGPWWCGSCCRCRQGPHDGSGGGGQPQARKHPATGNVLRLHPSADGSHGPGIHRRLALPSKFQWR